MNVCCNRDQLLNAFQIVAPVVPTRTMFILSHESFRVMVSNIISFRAVISWMTISREGVPIPDVTRETVWPLCFTFPVIVRSPLWIETRPEVRFIPALYVAHHVAEVGGKELP